MVIKYQLELPDQCSNCTRFTYYVPDDTRGMAVYTPFPLRKVSPGQILEWYKDEHELLVGVDVKTSLLPVYYKLCDGCRAEVRKKDEIAYARNQARKAAALASGEAWCGCNRKNPVFSLPNKKGEKYKICDKCVLGRRKQKEVVAEFNAHCKATNKGIKACRECQKWFQLASFCAIRYGRNGAILDHAPEGPDCQRCVIVKAANRQILNYLDTLTLAREKRDDLCQGLRPGSPFGRRPGQCPGPTDMDEVTCGMQLLDVIRQFVDDYPTNEMIPLVTILEWVRTTNATGLEAGASPAASVGTHLQHSLIAVALSSTFSQSRCLC
jgi:hypothetical protein